MGCVLFFDVASRDDVDRGVAALTAAGYVCQKAPEDVFGGVRYAIVEDPDGNAIGLTSPTRRRATDRAAGSAVGVISDGHRSNSFTSPRAIAAG